MAAHEILFYIVAFGHSHWHRGNTLSLSDIALAQEPKLEATLRGNSESFIDSLAFSPDGKTLSQAGEAIIFWDLGTNKPRITLGTNFRMGSQIAFSPDSKTLAVTIDTSTIKIYNVATGENPATFIREVRACFESQVAFSPDGNMMVHGSRVTNWISGRWIHVKTLPLRICQMSTLRVCASPETARGLLQLATADLSVGTSLPAGEPVSSQKRTLGDSKDSSDNWIAMICNGRARQQPILSAWGRSPAHALEEAAKEPAQECRRPGCQAS